MISSSARFAELEKECRALQWVVRMSYDDKVIRDLAVELIGKLLRRMSQMN